MAYSLNLPKELQDQGWKVKIRDKERTEFPHVSVLRKTKCWRYGLRERGFLDRNPPSSDIPDDVLARIDQKIDVLMAQWVPCIPKIRCIAMKTKTETSRIFYVGRNAKIHRSLERCTHSLISSGEDMVLAVTKATSESIWIASSQTDFCKYLKNVHWPIQHSLGDLLLLASVSTNTLTPLRSAFKSIALPCPENAVLAADELIEVCTSPNRRDLAIAAAYDHGTRTLTVWRGDFSQMVVPSTAFDVSREGSKPDYGEIAIIDYGQTIRLGSFEASVDSLLYEFDDVYRRQLAKERRAKERGFGPSLRRLRTQKGLSRSAFAPVSAKTIARIERQEVKTPHGKTLAAIANRLKVPSHQIESY